MVGTLWGHRRGTTLPARAFPGVPLIGSFAPEETHSKGLLVYSCHLVIRCVWSDRHYTARVSTRLLEKEFQSGRRAAGLPLSTNHTAWLSFARARLVGEGRWWSAVGDGTHLATARRSASKQAPNVSPPYMTTSPATNLHQQPTPQLGLKEGCKNVLV